MTLADLVPERTLRASAIAAEQARLDAQVRDRRARLDAARKKTVDDPDWEEWILHLAQSVEEAERSLAYFQAMQRESAARDAARSVDRDFARTSAEALVAAIHAAGGPQQVRVWEGSGTGVRVYFPGQVGFLHVGEDGSIGEVSRGRLHFLESGLFPAWRRAVREARRVYAKDLGARLDAHGRVRAARMAEAREGRLDDRMGGR